jgi:hypothetical protein
MAEKITLQGKEVCLNGDTAEPHVFPLSSLAEEMVAATLRGLTPEPTPDNVKWSPECGKLRIWIVQLTPELRWIKWLAPHSRHRYGPKAEYTEYALATPYVVLKVPVWDGHIIPRIEVFYRNQPLEHYDGEGGELFWPNLLNVSVNAYQCTAWFCSQYLTMARKIGTMQSRLNEVAHHLWGGGFNASSEAHEGLSTFGLCVKEKIDERVTDVARWAEASQTDPDFVLTVKWKTTGLTIKDLVEREVKFHKLPPAPRSVRSLVTSLLGRAKPK